MARFIRLPPRPAPLYGPDYSDTRLRPKYINVDLITRVEATGIAGECRFWFVGQLADVYYLDNIVYMEHDEFIKLLNSPESNE